jgi:hypothetical protein
MKGYEAAGTCFQVCLADMLIKHLMVLPLMLSLLLLLLLMLLLLLLLQVQLEDSAPGFDDQLDQTVACQLAAHLQERMAGYK